MSKRCSVVPAFILPACLLIIAAHISKASEAAVERFDGGVRVRLDGQPFAEYLTKSGAKPIVWPIIGPHGQQMTRNFPMLKVEGEKQDHPHHRSLWFTHGDMNGIDFWAETPKAGKVIHRDFLKCAAAGPAAVISTVNDWVAPDGKKQCEDVRTLTFRGNDEQRTIDFDITLKATEGPVVFGDTKEGTMGLRVPTSIDADQKDVAQRGEIVNSEGQKNDDAWGKPAAWVDYHGKVDDELVGIAILNHPSSFRFPTYWHVRTYGLFAANPFGVHDFRGTKDAKEGAYTLPAGETMTLRYRFLFHAGDEKAAHVAEAFKAYSQEPRP